jgi:serine/threonine-protein kinase
MDHASGQHATAPPDPAAKKAATVDLTGQTLGDYHILRRLGEGGMGQVYVAEQVSLKRKVALKILRADLAANATSLERFKQEALAIAQATHANIVQVYDMREFKETGQHYMALEYVEGRNLRQYLEKKGPPELMLMLSIIRQVAAALQRASELGIIHRDIKPENILLTRKGEVKVADFGLSRIFSDDKQPLNLTQTGVTMGTPLYMSPEQVEGQPIDPRTDIYSFGVTCYHMLAGQPPFRGQSAFEVAVQHVQKQPVPLAEIRPDLPVDLCILVHRMMAKKPDERIQTGREIIREVVRLRDNLVGLGVTQGSTGIMPAGAAPGVGGSSSGQQTYVMPLGASPSGAAMDATSTQPLPRPAGHPLLPLAVVTVLMALAAGLGYGWMRNLGPAATVQPHPQPKVQSPPDVPAPPKPFSEAAAEEKRLLEAVASTDGGKNLGLMLDNRIKLGLFYLKERRLDDAEKVFKPLEEIDKTKEKEKLALGFRLNGLLGKAMVLAFRDKTEESNKIFLQVLRPQMAKDPPAVLQLYRRPDLAEMVARALDYNHLAAPALFPAALEPYRHPPRVKGPDKGSG